MKKLENDIELKKLIREMKLESPDNEFTMNVMNRVFEEKAAMEKVEKARILGRGFWIIVGLFVILIAITIVSSYTGVEQQGFLSKLMEGYTDSAVSKGYESIFSRMGTLPLSIAGILIASSLLVFIDRFLHNLGSRVHLKKA